jgi:phosphate transport system permease protein
LPSELADKRTAARGGTLGARRAGRIGDQGFRLLTLAAALLVLAVLVGILGALIIGAWPAISAFGLGFLETLRWNPVTERFGALGPVTHTVASALIALLLAVPVSVGIAIFLTEVAPRWLRRPIGTAIELLAAIPSIIYGMWGLFVLAPLFASSVQKPLQAALGDTWAASLVAGPPLGIGLATAGIILAVMIVPFVATLTRDVFLTVPPLLKESAYALGATRWEVIRAVVFGHARAGIVGAVMLGLGRALGETMAVTFVIGNAHRLAPSVFMPGATIASTIANEFTEAVGDLHSAALIELGLLLFVITFAVLAAARLLLRRLDAQAGA